MSWYHNIEMLGKPSEELPITSSRKISASVLGVAVLAFIGVAINKKIAEKNTIDAILETRFTKNEAAYYKITPDQAQQLGHSDDEIKNLSNEVHTSITPDGKVAVVDFVVHGDSLVSHGVIPQATVANSLKNR